ncbi:hypothetical protein M422DRAFT_187276 [Sphaerobolus stellatus SS14]|uniref:ABC transporter domain-containing protein n=1 Tax=Sphaerobolus stellatus (strain SS14) TaxID=990650 RepID=A0A0C9UYU2_SPHS4|nr:hypothetical protein M422DRAFT_187276 [Sphaerobolus stellatus SS14]
MLPLVGLLVSLLSAWTVVGQSCQNYGTPNGTSCSCPPGFGGTSCDLFACGGTLFEGSSRTLAKASGSQRSNLTSCACDDGWGGTGCNVCQTAKACQTAFNNVHGSSSNTSTPGVGIIPDQVQNVTMTCNAQSRVYAAGEMSCNVLNPTLQSVFPLKSELNILRTLNASLSPIPGTTSFGSSGSAYAQLIYDGVEQFYCTADKCVQELTQGSDWTCQDLQCTCINGTEFCGGGTFLNLQETINNLSGSLEISCSDSNSCSFKQQIINSLFTGGLSLTGCTFGECVQQFAIDEATGVNRNDTSSGSELSGGVIAGLVVVGVLVAAALVLLVVGKLLQYRAAKRGPGSVQRGGVGVRWEGVGYAIPRESYLGNRGVIMDAEKGTFTDGKVILEPTGSRGVVRPGEMLAILGPSGAGKTTFVEILAGKRKIGKTVGKVEFFDRNGNIIRKPRIGFVDQTDILPTNLTSREALMFAANLRLPESISHASKVERVSRVLMQLGLEHVADTRIGNGERRGISGGEMRRVSLGCELVAGCDVVVLDEPTSGLDSVSAAKVTSVLHSIATDSESPTAVIASIHQPNSKLYMTFSNVLLFSQGRVLYMGPGGLAPSSHFVSHGLERCPEGYNVADWLLEIASDPKDIPTATGIAPRNTDGLRRRSGSGEESGSSSGGIRENSEEQLVDEKHEDDIPHAQRLPGGSYATTFLTQFEVLAGREWKTLKRDKTLFLTHVAISCVLGVFVGKYVSRRIRPLFLRERAVGYYSPTAWLLSRIVFDMIPLRIIPTIIVSTITYWMTGLAPTAANYFKFLFILVLYTMAMTLFNFLLGCLFRNGGIAILLSALTALYQQTYAGFFVHLNSIPPVLRWLQWLAPLKYTLEALSVNEVGSGLMIKDTLQGVPISVSASLIMNLLFGFGSNNYYRDVLVLFAFVAGFVLMVLFAVWFKVRERR